VKAFQLTDAQVTAIVAALAVDELGVRFGRHVDTVTRAIWAADTPLFEAGAELSPAEADACRARVRRFFGVTDDRLALAGATFGDWGRAVGAAIGARLTQFAFAVSGDDGREIAHAADAIFADAAAAANLLYGRRRIVSLVAPHVVTAFVLTTLTPNLLRVPAVDARALPPEELRKFLAFGDAVVATPSVWRYLIAQRVYAPDNVLAVSFGETLSPEISAEIRKAGFGAQREIYGSTENGVVAWRDEPSDPFALFDQWARSGDRIERILPSGERAARDCVDSLNWEGERRFRLGVRRDGAIQIGAVAVYPARIAEKIAEHPLVDRCAVSVSRHAGGGDRLVATIRLASGGRPSESAARAIDAWCRTKLRPWERPRVYNYADEIET
jgi:4-coumarate--CoA ligase (photoactive yellow protein activation family)